MIQRTWREQRFRQLKTTSQTPGPLAGGLSNLATQVQRVASMSSDTPGLLPAADLSYPTGGGLLVGEPTVANQERFQGGPSLAATRANPFSRPSTDEAPRRSSPARASPSWRHPERETTAARREYRHPHYLRRLPAHRHSLDAPRIRRTPTSNTSLHCLATTSV